MSSKWGGTALSNRSYRLASDTDMPKVAGIVNEKLLSDYLNHIFPSTSKPQQPAAAFRKPLSFLDLGDHLDRLLAEGEPAEENKGDAHDCQPIHEPNKRLSARLLTVFNFYSMGLY
ncbi:UNVERIFIED_CONTAM: hypothetical protein FKN15_064475 [Acipenser sinensis]